MPLRLAGNYGASPLRLAGNYGASPLRLAGNYGASRLRCLRGSTHEACETVSDGFHAFLRTQYATRRAEGAARGVTSLH